MLHGVLLGLLHFVALLQCGVAMWLPPGCGWWFICLCLPCFGSISHKHLLSRPFLASCICQQVYVNRHMSTGKPPGAAVLPLAELPGLPRKHLAAQLDKESGLLIISGSYPVDVATSSTETSLQERRHEQFHWEFRLPKDVAVEGISAKLENGELIREHPLPGSLRHCLHCTWPEPHVRSPGQPAL